MTNLCINIQPWLQLYPKIRPKMATLNSNLYLPFVREYYRNVGMVSVEKQSLINHLSTSNDLKDPSNKDGFTSNAVAITVGGLEEIICSHPRKYVVVLKNRKGFVKLALQTG